MAEKHVILKLNVIVWKDAPDQPKIVQLNEERKPTKIITTTPVLVNLQYLEFVQSTPLRPPGPPIVGDKAFTEPPIGSTIQMRNAHLIVKESPDEVFEIIKKALAATHL